MVGFIIELIVLAILLLILICLFLEEKHLKQARQLAGKLTGSWDGIEKRTSIRVDTVLNVKYTVNNLNKKSVSKNISRGGILIQVSEKLNKSIFLFIDIYLPNEPKSISAKGEVVWVKELTDLDEAGRRVFDTGIRFVFMHPKDSLKLNKHIKRSL